MEGGGASPAEGENGGDPSPPPEGFPPFLCEGVTALRGGWSETPFGGEILG